MKQQSNKTAKLFKHSNCKKIKKETSEILKNRKGWNKDV